MGVHISDETSIKLVEGTDVRYRSIKQVAGRQLQGNSIQVFWVNFFLFIWQSWTGKDNFFSGIWRDIRKDEVGGIDNM